LRESPSPKNIVVANDIDWLYQVNEFEFNFDDFDDFDEMTG
jgi:hypothetical protein